MNATDSLWRKILEGDEESGLVGLIDVSLDAYKDQDPCEGDIKLILNIICQAAVDRDTEYFNSLAFKEHCWLTRLKRKDILKIVYNTWK